MWTHSSQMMVVNIVLWDLASVNEDVQVQMYGSWVGFGVKGMHYKYEIHHLYIRS